MTLNPSFQRFVALMFGVVLLWAAALLPVARADAAASGHSASDVYEYDPFPFQGDQVAGAWSRLVRTDSGVSMTSHTLGLTPGAYTIWWGVFNHPEFCQVSPCTVRDLPAPMGNGDPRAEPAVIHATGHVVGQNGQGNFAAHLSVGDDSGAIFGQLTNPRGAEIHLIVKNFGPVIPGLVADQIHAISGACVENFGGPNCPDVQFSIHQP